MKLSNLLEGAVPRQQLLKFQQELVDQLDDDFNVQVSSDKILIRHPSLKQPMKLDMKDPEHVRFYAQKCSINHPLFIHGVVEIINERMAIPKMKAWLLAHGFKQLTNDEKAELCARHNVTLYSAGSKMENFHHEAHGSEPPIIVMLGYDSYKNVHMNYMLLPFDKMPQNKFLQGHDFEGYDDMVKKLEKIV
jgi:hypothetical protein